MHSTQSYTLWLLYAVSEGTGLLSLFFSVFSKGGRKKPPPEKNPFFYKKKRLLACKGSDRKSSYAWYQTGTKKGAFKLAKEAPQ